MSKFHSVSIELKNKKVVQIRQAELKDAENLLNCLKTYIPQSEFIPKLTQEIRITVDQERDWINSYLKNNNSLLLIAEYNNEIIGNIDLTGSQRILMEHTAVIGMGMIKEWRNVGLGTILLSNIINWAKNNEVLEVIWLQVYTENIAGITLYKKLGFSENGIIQNFFKHDDKYFHNLTMSLNVK